MVSAGKASKELMSLLNQSIARELQVAIQYMWQHVQWSGVKGFAVKDELKSIAIAEMKHAEAIAENDIGKYQVKFFLIHSCQSFTVTCSHGHIVSLSGKKPVEAVPDRFFIIQDKDIRFHCFKYLARGVAILLLVKMRLVYRHNPDNFYQQIKCLL